MNLTGMGWLGKATLAIVLTGLVSACSESVPDETLERSRQMPQWFDESKLGIFIHWGPASVPAFAAGHALEPGELEEVLLGGSGRPELPYSEWYLYAMNLPDSATRKHHAGVYKNAPYSDFGPVFERRVEQSWDPDAWAELFSQTGARYVVLVTKHHDGYALWPSAVTNPQQADWFSERDLVGELATAVRKRGMRFGTYYSTGLDWSFNLVAEGDLVEDVMRSAPPGEAYGDYVFDQMSELIERYQPDLLWADIGYPTEGRLGELLQSYFAQVPDGVVNDRWGGVDALGKIAAIPGAASVMKALARWMVKNADPLADDPARIGFKTAEYASLPGISPFKWESTRGLGASFAYNTEEIPEDRLTAQELVHFLVDTVAKNGNVLINVGPDSYGMIPDEQQAPLSGLGNWLQGNGEAIYGSKPWIREANTRGRELRYTTKDNALYAIVFGDVEQTFTIEHPGDSWTKVEVLGANVQDSQSRDGMLQISLDRELAGPAVVVKLSE